MADSVVLHVESGVAAVELGTKSTCNLTSIQHPFTLHGRVVISKLLKSGSAFVGQTVTIGGWVKTGRSADKVNQCKLSVVTSLSTKYSLNYSIFYWLFKFKF